MVLWKLKPGMTVYEVKRTTGLSSFNGKWRTWTVKIIVVDEGKRMVFAACQGSRRWFPESIWSKWRLEPPRD